MVGADASGASPGDRRSGGFHRGGRRDDGGGRRPGRRTPRSARASPARVRGGRDTPGRPRRADNPCPVPRRGWGKTVRPPVGSPTPSVVATTSTEAARSPVARRRSERVGPRPSRWFPRGGRALPDRPGSGGDALGLWPSVRRRRTVDHRRRGTSRGPTESPSRRSSAGWTPP